MGLEEKKCVACEGSASKLAQDEIDGMLEQTPGWELVGDSIHKTYRFQNFVQAMEFANRVTSTAEEENHHPDLHVSWGKVRVELSTHSIGGLSNNDFIMAAKINQIYNEKEHDQAI